MNEFGGSHTTAKLDVIQNYLEAYTTALSRQGFKTVYFDAFAGSGKVQIGDKTGLFEGVADIGAIIEGSARRALQLKRPFDEYIFVEEIQKNVDHLLELQDEFPLLADRIKVRHSDANEEISNFCSSTNWSKTRSVVFLDPFGNQVDWNSIKRIAKTKSIDLWYLFPAGLGVNRLISKDGVILPDHEKSLNRLLGERDWEKIWTVETSTPDFFDNNHTIREKQANVDDITRFVIDLMKREFEGGVLNSWLPLGPNNAHWYSLLFAWSNPSQKATTLAKKLGLAVMNRK